MNSNSSDARAAIWHAVAQLCAADEEIAGSTYTPTFVDALSQVVYSQAETMGTDLECFAKHAKRAKISVDDVKLCARRNNSLLEILTKSTESAKKP